MKLHERQGRKQTNKKTAVYIKELYVLTGMINIDEQGFLKFYSILEERVTLNSQLTLGKSSL